MSELYRKPINSGDEIWYWVLRVTQPPASWAGVQAMDARNVFYYKLPELHPPPVIPFLPKSLEFLLHQETSVSSIHNSTKFLPFYGHVTGALHFTKLNAGKQSVSI